MIIAILIFLAIMSAIDIMFINKKIYSPIFVFNMIWLITLGLYELKLSTLQQDLSNRTLLIFSICILSYNITCIIAKYVKLNFLKNKFKINAKFKVKTIDDKVRIAKWIALILFGIQIIYSGGLPLIWKLTGDSRIYFDFRNTISNRSVVWFNYLFRCI